MPDPLKNSIQFLIYESILSNGYYQIDDYQHVISTSKCLKLVNERRKCCTYAPIKFHIFQAINLIYLIDEITL